MFEEVIWFVGGFEDGIENFDFKVFVVSLKDSSFNVVYVFGDVIEVYEGE